MHSVFPVQSLRSVLSLYQLERDVRPTSISHLGYAIGNFAKYLGHEPTLADLTDDAVNKWLLWLAEHGSRCTMRNYRVRLLTVWRFAVEIGLMDCLPLRVRKVRLQHDSPQAWSVSEVERLLEAAGQVAGVFNVTRVNRADFWRAIIRTAYDTGFRAGDLMRLKIENFSARSMVIIRQSKTGQVIVRWVWPETWQAIERIAAPERTLLFADILSRRSFFQRFAEIRKAAGLSGHFRWLRRTGASLVECDISGQGKTFLGHRSSGIAERYYIDPRLLQTKPILPPRLTG